MSTHQKKTGFLAIIVLGTMLFGSFSFSHAQQAVTDRRTQLEKELAEIQKQIDVQEAVLNEKKNERVSLERDLSIINAQIKEAQLSIKARTLTIEKLTQDIKAKEKKISTLSTQIDKDKQSVAGIMRKINDAETFSLPEILLGNRTLSQFFQEVDTYTSLKEALRESYLEMAEVKEVTEDEKADLEEKKGEQSNLLQIQEAQRRRIQQQEAEKKKILTATKGQEANYQKLLQATEKSAAAIRSELFMLRGSSAIPFEKALEYAKLVESKLNVRAAFILGIIATETNLGSNIGTGSWRVDMKDPRDTVPFLDICKRLGLDPDKMPVSKKPWYGWGGAMGPAQFIPSTWVLYEAKIAKMTGKAVPNPWDPYDAFMAAGILLSENGASKGGKEAERLAALRYFAGWVNATRKEFAFYGNDVMAQAEKYQKQINILEGR